MFPMDRKPRQVTVEYDSRGKRVTKTFDDAYESRRFYIAKFKSGKNPKIVMQNDDDNKDDASEHKRS